MIEAYAKFKLIVNIDESIIKRTNFALKAWGRKNDRFSRNNGALNPGLGMIAALTSNGEVFYSLSFRTTDHEMMELFMHHLEKKLIIKQNLNKDEVLFLLDGAPYHQDDLFKEYMR